MGTKRIEVTKKHLKWVTWSVLIATVLFVIASLNPALNSLDRTAFAMLYAARYLMLGCFITLALGLVTYRQSTPVRVTVHVTPSQIWCSPCDRENVWIVTQEDLAKCERNPKELPLSGDLRKIQIVVIRAKQIPETLAMPLHLLKHFAILDVQGSTIPAGFWSGLEKCRDLEYVLARGAVESHEMKQMHMTLPEAKFYLDRRTLVIGSRAVK